MKTFESYVNLVGRIPKWVLVAIMVVPAYIAFGYMAYNKEPIYTYSEQIQEIIIGADEVGVMRDRDFTLCEERGGLVGNSGCILSHTLVTGTHRIPITYDVEIMDTSVQTWEYSNE